MQKIIALLVTAGVAVGLWALTMLFFNNVACDAVDTDTLGYPVFVKTAVRNVLLLCCLIDGDLLMRQVWGFLVTWLG